MSNYFKTYRRKVIDGELRRWEPGEDMTGISVSPADKANGSPMDGDWIARNPNSPQDQWLVSATYGPRTIAALSIGLVVARVLHAAGMLGYLPYGRLIGSILTLVVLLVSSIWCALAGLGVMLY